MPDLLAFAKMLDPERLAEHTFAVPAQGESEGFHPAGTMAAIVAYAACSAFAGQELRSIHLAFVGAASSALPLTAELSVLRGGRQLISAAASITQEDRLCAHGYALLGPRTGDVIRHQADVPAVPGPSASVPVVADNYAEVRAVGGVDPFDPGLSVPPAWDTWVASEGLPDRPGLMEALIAFEANTFLVSAAVLPHRGVSMHSAHHDLMAVITTSDVVYHATPDGRPWLRFSQQSTYAGGGWVYGRGLAIHEDGQLLASFSEEAMFRNYPAGRTQGMLRGAATGLQARPRSRSGPAAEDAFNVTLARRPAGRR
jgi:acyl-CoA thioesterase